MVVQQESGVTKGWEQPRIIKARTNKGGGLLVGNNGDAPFSLEQDGVWLHAWLEGGCGTIRGVVTGRELVWWWSLAEK